MDRQKTKSPKNGEAVLLTQKKYNIKLYLKSIALIVIYIPLVYYTIVKGVFIGIYFLYKKFNPFLVSKTSVAKTILKKTAISLKLFTQKHKELRLSRLKEQFQAINFNINFRNKTENETKDPSKKEKTYKNIKIKKKDIEIIRKKLILHYTRIKEIGFQKYLNLKSVISSKIPSFSNLKSLILSILRSILKVTKQIIEVPLFVAQLILEILLSPFRFLLFLYRLEIKIRPFAIKNLIIMGIITFTYVFSIFYFAILEEIPSPESLANYDPNLTTKIYDRKGNLLYSLYFDEDRSLVELKDVPDKVIKATLAIEDQSFYEHKGLSIKGIARAAKKTFLEDDLEGGSTITQQLVKNTLLTPERTFKRKLKEAVISIEVERRFTKDQILEMYLNTISYGGTAYGIKSASYKYFGKELQDLTIAEAAYLAGLPGAPSKYSPFSANPEDGKSRQKEVLRRMVAVGYITESEENLASSEILTFNDQTEKIKYPHFVNYVINELQQKYGQMLLRKAGLEVYTSIDPELQDAAQNIVKKDIDLMRRLNNVSNGAALITNPKTGEILAMVGSTDYWDIENDGNVNLTTAPRQPGSSIKPITYSLAMEKNDYNYNSLIRDAPVSYDLPGQPAYKPVNYDGRFHGVVTLKSALANSYNIPAVKLADEIGVSNLIDWGQKLGISTWTEPERYGLSITLGAAEVKMVDMATAYGTFANGGELKTLNPVLKIYDTYGNVFEENPCVNYLDEGPSILTKSSLFDTKALASDNPLQLGPEAFCKRERVMSSNTAYYITSMLSDNAARAPAFGTNSNLNLRGKEIAVKTGTTQNVKDNWTIGYNNDYVIATWIGNNNGDPMRGVVSGYSSASGIWRHIWDYLIANRSISEKIEKPSNLVEVNICPLTNTLACSACPNKKVTYVQGEEPTRACNTNEVISAMEKLGIKDENEKDEDKDNEDEGENSNEGYNFDDIDWD